MDKKRLILIFFFIAIVILAAFWSSKMILAAYYSSGYFISTNLLSGVSPAPASIDSFVYSLSAKPTGTTATVGFNQDGGSTWYDAAGNEGTETLVEGDNNTITLTSGWSGANFYYRVDFTSDGTDTPVLDEITVNYSVLTMPSLGTISAIYITTDSATLRGEITATGGENADWRGLQWGTSQDGPYPNGCQNNSTSTTCESGPHGTGIFSDPLTGLNEGQTYYFRSMAHNSAGWGYGAEESFVTKAEIVITITIGGKTRTITIDRGGRIIISA